jgi:hypothetical protein
MLMLRIDRGGHLQLKRGPHAAVITQSMVDPERGRDRTLTFGGVQVRYWRAPKGPTKKGGLWVGVAAPEDVVITRIGADGEPAYRRARSPGAH